ncbi:MAG: hypothetical protein J1E41_06180 [Ruminococcus sp.]|nr:hypothetical protein [Ruminococcus sp.]
MNDIFIEQLVKKKRTMKDRIIFIAIIIMVILIPLTFIALATQKLIIAYFIYIAVFLLFFGIWLVWFVRSHQNVEFEYQMVQDTLVVSKIIAKRKRKEIMKLDVRLIDLLLKGDEPELQKLNFAKVYDAAVHSSDDKNTTYAVYQHAVYGRCALMFNPNEKVLNAMKPYLKKEIVLKVFYNRG